MKTLKYSWSDIEREAMKLGLALFKDDWKPDYIVGIIKDGVVPGLVLANMIDVQFHTLDVPNGEMNCWMAEDGYGEKLVNEGSITKDYLDNWSGDKAKNILLVTGYNNTGETLEWIKKDWESGCLPGHIHWNSVWGNNVRRATIVDNPNSSICTDYAVKEVDPEEVNVVFPWDTN